LNKLTIIKRMLLATIVAMTIGCGESPTESTKVSLEFSCFERTANPIYVENSMVVSKLRWLFTNDRYEVTQKMVDIVAAVGMPTPIMPADSVLVFTEGTYWLSEHDDFNGHLIEAIFQQDYYKSWNGLRLMYDVQKGKQAPFSLPILIGDFGAPVKLGGSVYTRCQN
jgi:hypothetical protein